MTKRQEKRRRLKELQPQAETEKQSHRQRVIESLERSLDEHADVWAELAKH